MSDRKTDNASLFQSYLGTAKPEPAPKEAPAPTAREEKVVSLNAENIEKYDAYGIDRTRKKAMLDVKLADGTGVIIPFHDIRGAIYVWEHTIVIFAAIGKVTVEGHNLSRVLDLIRNHELDYLRESSTKDPNPENVVIQRIRFDTGEK